jgi:hypothetical protein
MTRLSRLTLTFRRDGTVDAVFVRTARNRRRHNIHGLFNDDGWFQWGETRDILAENVCTMERIRTILDERGARDE